MPCSETMGTAFTDEFGSAVQLLLVCTRDECRNIKKRDASYKKPQVRRENIAVDSSSWSNAAVALHFTEPRTRFPINFETYQYYSPIMPNTLLQSHMRSGLHC